MANIVSNENEGNVYLFMLLIFLSVISFRKVKSIEKKRKEITEVLMEPTDNNIL